MQKEYEVSMLALYRSSFLWLETKQYPNNTPASSAGSSLSRHGHRPQIPCLLLWRRKTEEHEGINLLTRQFPQVRTKVGIHTICTLAQFVQMLKQWADAKAPKYALGYWYTLLSFHVSSLS